MGKLSKVFENISGLFFLLMLVLILVQIFYRFIIQIGVPWTEEISRLFFIYLTFVGGAIAVHKGVMIVVDTVPNTAKGRVGEILKVLINLFSILFVLIMFVAAIILSSKVWSTTLS